MRAYATSGALAALTISVCLTLTIVQADPRDIYAGLCRDEEVGLTKVSQIGPLISFVNSPDASTIGCDPEVKDAILDLAEPLQVDDPDNHCTVERVNRIINYLYKHVRPQEPTEEVPEPVAPMHTPKALKRFFVSYALTVSKICKLGMLKLLLKDSKSLVERDDYNEVLRWTEGSDKQTKTFLGRAMNYDDIFLVGNALCDSELQPCRKLYVQNVYWERLRSMRNTCHRVFRPFYGQLIMPIVRLANAGIDYMDGQLRDSLDDLRENPDLQKWYKVVFLCESLANVIALPPPKQEHHEPEVVVDEEALKKIDEEERKELEVEVEEEGEEVVDVIRLNQDCPIVAQKETDENGRHVVLEKKEPVTKDGVEIVELTECEDGKKVIKIKKRAHKSKGLGSMLFGKDTYLAKELRRLQQERRAYLLSKKSMPVTNVMLKKDVLKYEQEHGPIDVDDFGNEPDVEYKPKPMIHINDDLMPLTDRRIIKAIRKYEKRRKHWRKVLRKISRKYVRLFRRITLLGRVKFGGKQKQKVETEELMFRVFDNAMWRKANPEMVKQEKGIWRKMLEFQNISNIATCVSMTLGIIFFILSCTLGLGR